VEEHYKPAVYFKRYEQKYLLNQEQHLHFMDMAEDSFQPDTFGPSTIYSVYYDTSDFSIIRKAFIKNTYREKLRLRSYGIPKSADKVYIEMKKKYRGVSYKRRFSVHFGSMENLNTLPVPPPEKRGLFDEFNYFYERHALSPSFFISCDRIALESKEDSRLRLTFDTNIRWRSDRFDFSFRNAGHPLLKTNECLMELKTVEPIPLSVCAWLTQNKIFPTSFSKSKLAYRDFMSRYKGAAL
jgi:SPX domain protein involved in polyphosphate accumulation